jgi:regulatory protein
MFRGPRKLSSEPDLYACAIRALMRRAHSVCEMRQVLERRAQDTSVARKVLDRLREQKLLDDARYAVQFVRYHIEIRQQGKFRITRDLRARGIADRDIAAAFEEAVQQNDESAIVRKRIVTKLKLFRGEMDDRKMASLYRSLLRAGFSSDVIRRELRTATKEGPGGRIRSEEDL